MSFLILMAGVGFGATAGGPGFDSTVPVRAITHGPNGHWFAYYDKFQFDPTDRYVLGMEVGFQDRTPTIDDTIKLGVIDLEKGDRWTPFAESSAWCWQQGCMLQWLPGSKDTVIYNARQDGKLVAVIQNPFSGEKRILSRPVYAVSPDGKHAVSINFARLDDTRPGYGYKGVDPWADQLRPNDDGIYSLDLDTGDSKLIISYDQIAAIPQTAKTDGKHWFNHLLFNTDGSRFSLLHRAFPDAPKGGLRVTRLFTANPDGSNICCLADHGMVSHYIWRDPKTILGWSTEPEGSFFHLYSDQTDQVAVVGKDVLTNDGHCSYSPDGAWVVTDGYPDKDRMQPLMLFRPADGKLVMLGKFLLAKSHAGEFRCDLHPRWSRDGRHLSIDSMHEGDQRQIYLLDVSRITQDKS